MSQCLTCRNAKKCTLSWKNPSKWMNCTGYIRSPETNADRIRSMSDEEFSHFLFGIQCAPASRPKEWLDWLKQEAE